MIEQAEILRALPKVRDRESAARAANANANAGVAELADLVRATIPLSPT